MLEAGPSQMCMARPALPCAHRPGFTAEELQRPGQGAPTSPGASSAPCGSLPPCPRRTGLGRSGSRKQSSREKLQVPPALRPEPSLGAGGGASGDSGRERPPGEDAVALGLCAPAAAPLGGRWIRERGQVSG